ncbi:MULTISPECIES: vWA domain-containing protein [Paenibacillus]|uniref:vWA domain-containing protein n=1 Tax=Paenibacillus TaxID=44249 RepID=UPI0013EC32AE|nr:MULTISPECIES: vWA domain-containing protein [unclassified Paenibacillus]KAF6580806.1 VWA domain-containing protein [Paenibacillus sp. EKM212P]MCP3794115.1 VWA domain-containing protein [Paenibacillus sp. CH40]
MFSRDRKWFLVIGIICTMIMTSILAWQPQMANAASPSASKVDAVLVVDVSNSMNTSDPGKIGNEAMKMFIDMLSTQNDKVGIVAYTDVVQREKALLNITSEADKQELKTFIDGLNRGAYTDTSVGVKEAIRILQDGKTAGHAPMIVMLADGNNDFNKTTGRTESQSDQDMAQAVAEAKNNGVPIYTIGLNADGKLNKNKLADIAQQTGGKSFITSSADDLPNILSEIFASNLKLKVVPLQSITANGDYQDVTVTVPNDSVLEANISIMSSKPVDARLIDPSGNTKPIPSSDVLLSKSKSYSLIKLLKPVAGDWKLQVKGVQQDQIDINLVFNYDLELKMDAPSAKSYKKGDAVQIRSYLTSNSQQLQDQELYANMNAVLKVKDLDSGTTNEVPLTNAGDSFTGSYTIPDEHDYELTVRAEEKSFYRETQPVTISAKAGATSGTNTGTTQPTTPAEKSKLMPLILLGLGLLVLLVAAYFIWKAVKKANRGFVGQIVLEIRDENTGEKTYPQYKKLNTFRGKFNLHQLLQLAPEFAGTDKVVFTPANQDRIIVRSTPEITIEKSGRAVDTGNGLELKNGDRLTIPLASVDKTILLEFISVNS